MNKEKLFIIKFLETKETRVMKAENLEDAFRSSRVLFGKNIEVKEIKEVENN